MISGDCHYDTRIPSLELENVLNQIGRKLSQGEWLGTEVGPAVKLWGDLPPGEVVRADGEVAVAANLFHRPPTSGLKSLFSRSPTDAEQLPRTPGLEYVFLFHRDGRLREAALQRIAGGLPTPFFFAAVLWRLNDWAAPVRAAAARCANRSFPGTEATIVVQALACLTVRQASWGRWTGEREIFDQLLTRNDVTEELAKQIIGGANGPWTSVLRYAFRTTGLDAYIERMALEAVQPSVRATAWGALINRKAEWPVGLSWQWIDKSMGLRRKVTIYDHRPLNAPAGPKEYVARGIEDRSPVVRRVAMSGAIRHLAGTLEGQTYAAALIKDKSPSVRERAKFFLGMNVVS